MVQRLTAVEQIRIAGDFIGGSAWVGGLAVWLGDRRIATIMPIPGGYALRWLPLHASHRAEHEIHPTREAAEAAVRVAVSGMDIDPWPQRAYNPPMNLQELDAKLDDLEKRLPDLIKEYPDQADFWNAFAGETDYLFDSTKEHFEHVRGRVDKMLADNCMIPDDG